MSFWDMLGCFWMVLWMAGGWVRIGFVEGKEFLVFFFCLNLWGYYLSKLWDPLFFFFFFFRTLFLGEFCCACSSFLLLFLVFLLLFLLPLLFLS